MRKSRNNRYGHVANTVRNWVGAIFDVEGSRKAFDLDKKIIPTLRELMGKRYQKAVNRAFLLNCLTIRDSGFVLHFDGDRMYVKLARSQRRHKPRAANVVSFVAKSA